MKVYDVFQEEWISENEIDIIAPPERYIYVDIPNLESQDKHKSLDMVVTAVELCTSNRPKVCEHCPYDGTICVDVLLKDVKYYLERYKRSLYG